MKTFTALSLVSVSWLTTEGGLECYWKRYKIEEATGHPPPFTTDDLSIQLPSFLHGENAFVSSNTYLFLRYADTFNPLYLANLIEAQVSIRPTDWEEREAWLSDQEVEFRRRLTLSKTNREKWSEDERKAFAKFVRRNREARGDGLQGTVALIGNFGDTQCFEVANVAQFTVQTPPLLARDHSVRRSLVPSVSTVLPRRCRSASRTGRRRRQIYRLSMGSEVRP